MYRRLLTYSVPTAALMLATQLWAGGFFLQLGNPEASPEALKLHAALTFKAAGCEDPASGQFTAEAIGMVKGERKRIQLRIDKLSEPGFFAIAQQWPKEGHWVIDITGHSNNRITTTLVAAGPDGIDRYHAKSEMRAFSDHEVDQLLATQ